MMLGRIAWAGVAFVAALVALGFAITAGTLALADAFGLLIAVAAMAGVLAVVAALSVVMMWRAPWRDEEEKDNPLAVVFARDLIRAKPLSALALFVAVGFAAAKRPKDAVDLGRGVARLIMS